MMHLNIPQGIRLRDLPRGPWARVLLPTDLAPLATLTRLVIGRAADPLHDERFGADQAFDRLSLSIEIEHVKLKI